jgi:hypothetical protein
MESEITTMTFVKNNTSLPVPTVYTYNLSINNCLGTPYMMIERMPEESIEDRIFRDGGIYTHQISKVISQVREYMNELTTLHFDKIGRLGFNNTITSFSDISGSPFSNSREYYLARMNTALSDQGLKHILCNTYEPLNPEWDTAMEPKKLKLALWVFLQVGKFLGAQTCDGPFPLDHGDWNDQNVLVNEDYCVVGVIDWEMARTCALESLQPSKLFRYTLKDVSPACAADYFSEHADCRQTNIEPARPINPQLQELVWLFEWPRFPQQFVGQVQPLIRCLHTNFEEAMKQMIPSQLWSIFVDPESPDSLFSP